MLTLLSHTSSMMMASVFLATLMCHKTLLSINYGLHAWALLLLSLLFKYMSRYIFTLYVLSSILDT